MADRPFIVPFLRYRDARSAVEWLQDAFGFEPMLVIPEEGDTVEHAQLRLGSGILMLSTLRPDDLKMTSPTDAGGVTQGIYVFVEEVDALFERARSAGAEVVREPTDQDYGGRDFTVRDLEGHLWSFGTYDPLADS